MVQAKKSASQDPKISAVMNREWLDGYGDNCIRIKIKRNDADFEHDEMRILPAPEDGFQSNLKSYAASH